MLALLLASLPAGLEVGGHVQDIAPEKVPVSVVGYFTARYASEVADQLAARTLVIRSGETRVAVQVVDSCGVSREDFDAAKRVASEATGIPAAHMFLSATHTHTAPSAMPGLGTDADPDYRKQLVRQMAASIIKANRTLRPAEAGWAQRDAGQFVYCRRWRMRPGTAETHPFTGHAENAAMMNPGHANPDKLEQTGPVDPAVMVLAFRDPRTKRPLAVLGNFNTHYAGAPMMSSDYFGVFCRRIGAELQAAGVGEPAGGFTALMSNGTSGDANCIDFSAEERRAFDHVEVAEEVMEKAVAAYRSIDNWSGGLPLRVAGADVTFDKRLPSADELKAAKAFVAPWVADRLPRNKPEVYAREAILLSEEDPTETVRLQTFALGDFALTAIPCEVYGGTGLRLKAESPFPFTMNVGWANGYSGYLPPPDQHALGGYTTWRARSSFLEEGAEPRVVAELLRQLRSLRE